MAANAKDPQACWHDDAGLLPSVDWRQCAGGFGAALLLTDKAENLINNWKQVGPSVKVHSVAFVPLGQTVSAFITFFGCAGGVDKRCELTGRFQLLDPRREVVADTGELKLYDGDAGVPTHLALGEEYADFYLPANGEPGHYVVRANVSDRNAGRSLTLTLPLEVQSPD